MARDADVIVTETVTQLTNANAAAVTIQNKGIHDIYLKATANTTAPSSSGLDGWTKWEPGMGRENIVLADFFPGITSPVRLWAVTRGGSAPVYVSHADA